MQVYPWQHSQWQRLYTAYEADRFPHGLLLTGPRGMGLAHFAQCLSSALLCDAFSDDGSQEDESRDWQLFNSGNHPDYLLLEPEEEGKQIKIDQIRELTEFLQLTSQYGRKKIAIIKPADNMNRNAANGLLKTLEEPPEGSLLLLVSYRPSSLPITIRSRCQTLQFKKENNEASQQWLAQRIGQEHDVKHLLDLAASPLAAVALMENNEVEKQGDLLSDLRSLQAKREDPIKMAEKWNAKGAENITDSLQNFFVDMLRLKISSQAPRLQCVDLSQNLHQMIKGLDLFQLLSCYEFLGQMKSRLNSSISFNTQGLLEEFIIHWQSIDSMTGGKIK